MSTLSLDKLTVAQREALLELARKKRLDRKTDSLPPVERIDRNGPLQLSFAQQRLWFIEQFDGIGAAYHIRGGMGLIGPLDRSALKRALDAIVVRHESLRTRFVQGAGEPVQQIAPAEESGFHLVEHDLSQESDRDAALRRITAEEAGIPFDLSTGPLIRGRLVRLEEDEHAFLVTMHHIVSDGWSMGVFINELSSLYAAFRRGASDPLPPLEVQYADYAAWQRQRIAGDVLQRQADYWKNALAGAPEVLALPTDRMRPAEQDFAGAYVDVVFDEILTDALNAFSRKHGTTLFMTLLAGWAALLSRLSGQQDVVIGSPIANRSHKETENLIGFFVNTLALHIDLSGSPTVTELLERVKSRALEAQQNQDIPFEQVVEIARPARSLAHSPLFQVMFAWQNAPAGTLAFPDLTIAPLPSAPHVTAKFDLSWSLQESGGRISGALEYATALFDRATVERFADYYRALLTEMVAVETGLVDCLPILPASERKQLLEEWNATEAALPEGSVAELFEAQAERRADAVAVVEGDRSITYAELNARANRLAHHLRTRGVEPGDRVVVTMPRSTELVIAELAILKCGAAYVPVDATFPAERIAFMTADCGAKVVLRREDVDVAGPSENLGIGVSSETAAYVMYTSGSTGEPKGVVVPHRAVVRLVINNRYADFGADDRVAFASNPAFDATTLEVWAPLLNGGRIVVIDQDVLLDPRQFGEALRRDGVTVLWMTVGLFNQYVDDLDFGRLRYLIVGGDALDPRTIAKVLRNNPPQHLLNGYGPTETTTFAITHEIRSVEAGARSIPLGRPIGNTKIYILDERSEPVPVGVAGEIYIGGMGVALGYLNREELTSERFVENPFHGGRMYRTGDVGRWLAGGTIEFLGRNDQQVKIRGFRIELGEIEARLGSHASLREVVVVAREGEDGKRLVAYFTSDEEVSAEALRAHVSQTLPEYMVPAAYVRLDAMPLTRNGKVDRKALPAPEGDAYATREYEEPQGEIEQTLATIWADVLKVERVGRHDNFFELGGHSLLAVTLIERMRQQGLHADVRALFATPTVAELARRAGGEERRQIEVPPNRIPAGCKAITPEMLPLVELNENEIDRIVRSVAGGAENVQDIYPLAPLQEGILFHHLMANEGDAYLLSSMFAFDARERAERFVAAFQAVVNRHDILRTGVIWEGLREPVQVVWREAKVLVEEVQLDGTGGDAAAELYARFDPRRHRIDLRQAPLMRMVVARDEENDRWLLLLLFHHLIGDHTTMEVVHEEVESHLLGRGEELRPALPFRNFVAEARMGVSREEHEEFFRKLLGEVDEPTAPYGLLDVRGDGSAVGEARIEIEGTLARRVRERARKLGISAASLWHLAWAQVLARLSGREDVVFGTVLFGRMQGGAGADRVTGLFINTLPVRIRVDAIAVQTAARGTHDLLAELMRHEHASLALAQRCSGVKTPTPLFSSLLNYRHNRVAGAPSAESAKAWSGMTPIFSRERTNYPVTILVDDMGEGFQLGAQVQEPADAMRICRYVETALHDLVDALEQRPAAPLKTIDVLPAAERREVTETWNTPSGDFAVSTLPRLFEAQVARTPHAIALTFEQQSLTYADLNARANRLAHRLRELGVKPDARVAICAERSIEMVVAIIAVVKAGGAYVPLDPAYPSDRLRYTLDDCAPVALLTEPSLLGLFGNVEIPVVDLSASLDDRPGENVDCGELAPEDLAYVIYTSGSTGMPKGVMVEHRNVARLFTATDAWFHFDERDVWTLFHSFSFDFSVWELWGALLYGGRLIVVPKDVARSPEDFYALLCREGVTILNQTPSAFRQLMAAQAGSGAEHALRHGAEHVLRHVIFGGEALEVATLKPWFERNDETRTRLINMYGITETTVHVTYRPIGKRDTESLGASPIGSRIPDLRTYILDADRKPVPIGVTGELFVGGAGVARGYLNRPELTAERFVADPFVNEPGARLYKTGDLGRWLPDGTMEFLGRNDFQVKIRGFRIELGEIEARLAEHAAVRDVVVIAREDVAGDKRLVAYCAGDKVSAEELRAHAAERLPEHMVPAAYVWLESMPLTTNGKLDRKALPVPEGDAYVTRGYEAPQGEIEETLAAIWGEVLQTDRIGRHDNFFELGGHSLLVVTLIERMRLKGMHADVRAIFSTPTIAELAPVIGDESHDVVVPPNRIPTPCDAITPDMLPLVALTQAEIDRVVTGVPGGASNVQDIYPLAPLQEGILFHHRTAKEADAYVIFSMFAFDRRERLDAFLGALQAVVDRHDILRTSMAWEGLEEPVQVVWRKAPVPVDELELDPAAGDVAQQLYGRFDWRQYRIDVRHAPLLRVCIAYDATKDRWLFVLLLHHLIDDNTSLRHVFEEVQAHLVGRVDQLPPPQPYRNFVAQARLGISKEEHEAFFRKMLGDVDEPTAPFGLTDMQGDGSSGIREGHLELDSAVARRLRDRARKLGVSVASVCHLAWAQVLSRVSGSQAVVFGTVLFGRMRSGEGADRSLGMFINTLPVRIEIGDEGAEATVRRTHTLLADLIRHEHASLALAQRCSAVVAPAPLFSCLLNYRHTPRAAKGGEAEAAAAWEGIRGVHSEERSNYPLTLSINDSGEGFGLTVHVVERVDPMRVCRFMHTAIEHLLDALEETPAAAVHSIDVMPAEEREQVERWSGTDAAYPAAQCIHELIEAQVVRTPDAIAVTYGNESLTYAQLNARANQLAHYLRERGVGPDARVAISMPRSLDLMVALLAIVKAGGAYVPLDPAYPAERLQAIVEDSKPVVVLDSLAAIDLAGRPETNLERNAGAENLAYLIYTSGSTGKPKGVMLEHRGLVNHTLWQIATFGIDANDTILQRTSINFDASVWELWTPLAAGARMLLLPADAGRDPEAIARVLENNPITIAQFVPALLQPVLHAMRKPLPCRILFCGGEALPASLVREARAKGAQSVVNLYGPTEATVDSTYSVCGDEEPVSIGRPVSNTRVYILDRHRQPAPAGVAGEIYVGGVQVGKGYLNRPDLTAERFLADSFRDGRMYRTGDLGRWLSDGTIEFLGRNDFQVKLRGFRIELGEIESRLSHQPGVNEVVVVAREDEPGDVRLVAYYCGEDWVETEALREHLVAQLPDYMVPAAYVRLEALPLLPNGKLDRKALPAPDADSTVTHGFEEPQGELEQALAEVWADVLRVDRVGRHDNFFERGGHSLLAVMLIEKMRQRDLHAEASELFDAPTVAELAAAMSGQSNAVQVPANAIPASAQAITPEMLPLVSLAQEEIDAIVARVAGGAANVQDIYPLAPLQEGIFFHHLLGQAGDTYLLSTLYAFDNRERVDAFVRALQSVIDRHDILRTSIAWEELREPVQVVWRKAALPVEEVVLDPAAGEMAAQLYERFDPRGYRIDVGQAPWVRVCVAHDEARERWIVLLLLHHLAGDHTTLEMLGHEIETHLLGEEQQLPAALPFRNFVAQARLGMPDEAHETFFRKMLGDVDEPTAPFGLLEVQGEGQRIHEVREEVDPELARRIRERARKLGVSAASLFHLAWGAVLGRVCGRSDVVFGTVLFGRMEGGEGADRVMGLFINTLPVRIELGEEEVRSSVKRTHVLLTDLMRHEHASLAMAQRCSGVQAPAPLFSSLLNYRHSSKPAEQQGRSARAWEGITGIYGEERTNYPLLLSIDDLGEGFALTAQVQEPVEPKRVCTFMRTALEQLVEALEERPSAAVKTIDPLPAEERSQVLDGVNATAMEYPAEALMHELFEEQVERTPDAIALVHHEESLTYAELNRRSNKLARHLRSLGVGPDARVGICLDRSPRMLVSMLGVLKAGGAYVPLDPAYPADRLQFMTEDSEPVVVIDRSFSFDEASYEESDLHRNGTTSSNLAYVIYTSGSTGKPKGVAIEHRNAVNFITWAQQNFDREVLDRTLFSTSLNFDLAVFETFVPLSVGASLRIVANAMEVADDVTLINTVPSAIDALTEIGGVATTVRTINLAGEPLKRVVVEKIFANTNAERVCNLYGPSETTTYSSWVEMPRAEGFVGHIGRPVANTQIYLLDSERQPVPVGVVGEIYIGGAGVARGYLNRPELTAERFLDNPFAPGRMYKTGDLGRWLAEGNLEFLGRNDHQVKIRGFRIELGEIEARLAAHPGVKDAVVIAREERLIAYYAGEETNEKELRSHIAAKLPEHMVPSLFVRLEALPLTPNGKLDRKALPAPEMDGRSAEYEAPMGEVETALGEIWAEVLKLERVGRKENFFELGGHSLLAVTVIERMRRKGLHADVRALFASPTIAQLAAEVGSETQQIEVPANAIPMNAEAITPEMLPLVGLTQSEIDSIVRAVPGGAANVQDIYPLAPLQEGILFHHRMAKEGDTYLLSALIGFEHRDRLDRFVAAMQAVIDRHDILRTAVMWEGLPEPVQVVFRNATMPIEEVIVDGAAELHGKFDPRHYRIDLTQAPLLRVAIARDAASERWMLLLLLHHLAGDHSTMELLQREVEAFLSGEGDRLPAPLPFRNFVAQARRGVSAEEHEAFFKKMLGDVDEPTAPFGLLDVQSTGADIRQARVPVDRAVAQRIRAAARKAGVSAATLSHLAWALALSRISARVDVVFGTILLGRMQGDAIDRAMGLFINTLPLRITIGSDDVAASVRNTHALLAELMRHEHASLALAQHCSAVSAPAPLFSSLLNYRHSPGAVATADGVGAGMNVLEITERTNYPLALTVDDLGEDFVLTAQSHPSVDPMRVCRFMHAALERLIEALETEPAKALRTIDVMPESEQQMLDAWNDTGVDFPNDVCVHELFEAQVLRAPDAVAVTYGDDSLTYAELNARANRLAHHLRSIGVGPDARVAICIERSLAMMVGLLATLKAGGAYVPIDPAYPADRLRTMLEDAAPAAILTQPQHRELFAGVGVPVIDPAAGVTNQPATNPGRNGLTPDHLAYVIFTSGSTGKPKGVMLAHRGLVNHTFWQCSTFGIDAGDVVLQRTSISFDASVWELWTPLAAGARMLLLPADAGRDPIAIARFLERQPVTIAQFVPTLLQAVLAALSSDARLSCRYLFCGGEALPAALVAEARARGARQIVNLYGPTEATIDTIAWTCEEVKGDEAVPIGGPVSNTKIRILDGQGRQVPAGVAGEIHVAGVQVGRGYLNRPELTTERFSADPFDGGARMYRTGDVGRWRTDGAIEFIGRTDFQVKLRGFRVELGEIESRLLEMPELRDAVVIAREDDPGDRRLVAYYTGDARGAEVLREHVAATLPDYMVPSAFVHLESLPLTPNGKLDRKALPAPGADAYVVRGYEPPRGEIETALADVWSQVLRVERVGRHDNFFESGGHSLLAVMLIDRLRQRDLHAEVSDLFDAPTFADLAARIGEHSTIAEVPPNAIPSRAEAITPEMLPLIRLDQAQIDAIVAAVPGGAANVQDIYPLAPLQEGILFHHLMAQSGDAYLMPSLFAFESRARLDAYLAALQSTIDRHDILRTAVLWEELPEPVQVVWRDAKLVVHESTIDGDDVAGELYRRFDPRHHRIDVRQAPLMRAYVAYDGARDRWLVLLLLHHLAGDHTTLEVLQQEIGAHLVGRGDALPSAVPFRNFVAQARLGISREAHETFFTDLLGDVAEPTAPYGLLDVQGDGSGVREGHLDIDASLARRLRDAARKLGVSAASVCHLAWAHVLARVSGRNDVVFGTVLFGRMHADRAMGLFINTLPMRVRVGNEEIEASVRNVHALLADLIRHEHASLALAQRCSAVPAPAPLFASLLNYRHNAAASTPAEEINDAWNGMEALYGEERTNYPLVLSVDDRGEGFSLSAQVQSPAEPRRVCELMRTSLERLVDALERTPSSVDIDVLPDEERRLLEQWNETGATYATDVCVHELFEEQVRCHPGATAVVFENESLTYTELNARANRLAHWLRRQGVGPDKLVAVRMSRSLDMIVTLLGVLKAGGAYVPIDPAYPIERAELMIADSEPVMVLLSLDDLALTDEPETNPSSDGLTPANLAYVIYTSGSTGTPKGVAVEHRNLANLIGWHCAAFAVEAGTRASSVAGFGFDAAVWEMWPPLTAGATLVLPRDTGDVEQLLRWWEREPLDISFLPTPLAEYAFTHGIVNRDLETLLIGGDRLRQLPSQPLPFTLVNNYGPTENAVVATSGEVDHRLHIGRPIANTRIHIVDAGGRLSPIGVVGEIRISGKSVARGYLNRPELTAERFVESAGERMYRTGDLGRWLEDGTIEFAGRNDFQVKIRGYRIELGEIESRLSGHEAVDESIVVAREERLIAYYVGRETSADELREHLGVTLPEVMVPSVFVRLDAMPLTANGKIDRKALPLPDALGSRGYEPPQGEIEVAIAEIWADVLQVERVGRNDNFFELGGHSLTAVTVIERMRQQELHIEIRALFTAPTLAALAAAVEEIEEVRL